MVSVANQSGVQGIKGDVRCGSVPETVELRLNDQFQSLAFAVAEDNTSPSSDVSLVVTVNVNGHQVTAKQVSFNHILKLSVSVAAANAVVLSFAADDQSAGCPSGGEIFPVVFDAVLT